MDNFKLDGVRNVLILGDGNLSFSVSMIKALSRLKTFDKNVKLLVTTYDSFEDLQRKYPNCPGYIKYLSKFHNVTVKHSVDATTSLEKLVLIDTGISNSNGSNVEVTSNSNIRRFTDIIFNFPHLAIENATLHSSLLAHTIHQSMKVLSSTTLNDPVNGMIYISLAIAQGIRWKIQKMAELNHASIVCQIPFNGENQDSFPGYEIKRHHTGASFIRRVGNCVCYCIAANVESSNELHHGAIGVHETQCSEDNIKSFKNAKVNQHNLIGFGDYPNVFDFIMKLYQTINEEDLGANITKSYSSEDGCDISDTNGNCLKSKKELKREAKKRKSHTHYGDNFTIRTVPEKVKETENVLSGSGSCVSIDSGVASTRNITVYECNVCQKQFPMEQVFEMFVCSILFY